MRVKCIDNKNLITGNLDLLIIGKIYEVYETKYGFASISDGDKLYSIVDESGKIRSYDSKRFIDVCEIRNEKIDVILK